jgi:hypothetical protein
MSVNSSASILIGAYDEWVREEQPNPTAARVPLRALQQAIHECHRRGERLSSVPLLLQEASGGGDPCEAFGAPLKLSAILPELPPTALLSRLG